MKNTKTKIYISILLFIITIMIHLNVKAVDDGIAILEKQENEYVLYLEKYLEKDFYFAFSNSKDAKEGDENYPLNFITSKEDNKGNEVAYVTVNDIKTPLYMWIKVDDELKEIGMQIDFSKSISEEKINNLLELTKKIPVDTTETTTETTTENDVIKTTTKGVIKITDPDDATYYYSNTLLSSETNNYNKLMEITQKLNENLNVYDSILLYQEYEELLNTAIQSAKLEKATDRIINLPETANNNDQYGVLIKKEANGNSTYDIQFLTANKTVEQDKVERIVSTTQNAKLPITYDNPILLAIFGIGVVLLIVVFLRIKSLSKKNEKK